MKVKKAGLVAAGVITAVVAAAPLASATEPAPHGGGKVCTFTGGDAGAQSSIAGGSLANTVTQNPRGGDVEDNYDNCAVYDNNSGNNNGSGNTELPTILPDLGDVLDVGGILDNLPL